MHAPSNIIESGPADVHDLVGRAVEEEGARLARELNDELLQAQFLLRLDGQYLEDHHDDVDEARAKVRSIKWTLDSLSTSLRRVAAGLRPASLDNGFAQAIHLLAHQFTASSGIAFGLSIDEGADAPEPCASAAFRLIQEALHDVRKHANAQKVSVQIEKQGATLRVAVQDDGTNLDPAARVHDPGMGLHGMEQRVRAPLGDFLVASAPRLGTTVEARLPGMGQLRRTVEQDCR